MNGLRFALRGLWRDWRGGDLRLLALALILAVAAVTSVGFFTDRVAQALRYQGNELLAADLVIESPEPLPGSFDQEARQLGLRQVHSLSFPSVLMYRERPQLVQVKAVEQGYPLRGRLLLRGPTGDPEPALRAIPPPGEAWAEPRLLALLQARPGDSIGLGKSRLKLTRQILLEPDRGGNLFQLAPRLLLNLQDIPATGLVTPASRVRHRLLLAGEPARVTRFRHWSQSHLPGNARLLSIEDARPELRIALQRGSRFLALAALMAVLVTAAAVALASRRLVERQADAVAIMRCLGASRGLLRNGLLLRLLLLLLACGLLGAGVGYLAQSLLVALLGDWLVQSLPPPSPWPLFTGLATGALTLLGFALPNLLRLPRVPPLRVLRRELGPAPAGPWLLALAASGSLGLLLFWQAGDSRLAGYLLAGVALLLAALLLLGLLLIRLAGFWQRHARGIHRFGLASLSRHPTTTLLQICGFGLGIMAMLLLAVVRIDLLDTWEHSLPRQAPNRFLINILPQQAQPLADFLQQRGIADSGLHPMVRARLTHINQHPVREQDYQDPRARRLATREFNLSWGIRPQSDNQITAGRWWPDPQAPPQFSVEQGIAKSLGITLGDRLTFELAGESLSAPVTSLRSVKWDSFNVNFFVVGSPRTLRERPATYVTSFHLAPDQEALAGELIRRFPNVTLLDVSAILQQVRRVMARGSAAVEYVFLFTLAAGLLVLYAGIQAGAEGRRREAAILRTLGASRSQLLGAAAVEFASLGLLAGLLASLAAYLIGQLLARQVFQLDYGFSSWLWLGGVGGAVLGIGLAGLLATRPLLLQPPLLSLRRAE